MTAADCIKPDREQKCGFHLLQVAFPIKLQEHSEDLVGEAPMVLCDTPARLEADLAVHDQHVIVEAKCQVFVPVCDLSLFLHTTGLGRPHKFKVAHSRCWLTAELTDATADTKTADTKMATRAAYQTKILFGWLVIAFYIVCLLRGCT